MCPFVTKAASGGDGPRLWKAAIHNVSYTVQGSQYELILQLCVGVTSRIMA